MPQVQEVKLNFENLTELDSGKINMLVERHLAQIASDCINRPADETKRKVVLEFFAEPIPEEDGQCERAKIEIECRSKVPVYRSRRFEMRVSKGGFLFNKDFPGELDQPSLYDNLSPPDDKKPPAKG